MDSMSSGFVDPIVLTAIVGTFFLAGTVKGAVGMGMTMLPVGVLTAVLDLTTAMALLIVPALSTNIWQAISGGHGKVLIVRLWPFFVLATVTILLGANALTRFDLSYLSLLLGLVLIGYSLVNLLGVRVPMPRTREGATGAAVGAINGLLTGMTGAFVVPGVMFLQAIGLQRDALIQAMGILFTLSTIGLAVGLTNNNLLGWEHNALSVAAVAPAWFGLLAGRRFRDQLSERRFKETFFFVLGALGIYIVIVAFASSV